MTYDPKTYEQAQTAIEIIEKQLEDMREQMQDTFCVLGDPDRQGRVLDAMNNIYNDLVAQRDAIAERAVDLPTEAELRLQREQENEWNMYEQIRNDPYGGDDFALYNSGDCW